MRAVARVGHETTDGRLPPCAGLLRFSNPFGGIAHDCLACLNVGGGACTGIDALCVGTGRRPLDDDVGVAGLRRSSPCMRGFPNAGAGRRGISPLAVRWWLERCGLASERGSDGARGDGDAPAPAACDERRFTRSVLPLAGRFERVIVGDELGERCGACRWLFWLDGLRGPYDCIMNGAEGGRSGMPMSTPIPPMPMFIPPAPPIAYMAGICICICICCIGMPMGSADMGTGAMFMFHIDGIGGIGRACECRHDPLSDAIDPRWLWLWLPLVRRSRIRTSCCDDDGVGIPECIDGGREPVPEPEPYTLFGRESPGEPEPEPDAEPWRDGRASASDESEC